MELDDWNIGDRAKFVGKPIRHMPPSATGLVERKEHSYLVFEIDNPTRLSADAYYVGPNELERIE